MTTYQKAIIDGTTYRTNEKAVLRRSIGTNNASSRLTLTFENQGGKRSTLFETGQDVEFFGDQDNSDPTTKLFAGKIYNVKNRSVGNSDFIEVTCRDLNFDLQSAQVEPEVYTNQEVSAIVLDILDKYGPAGVTTVNVQNTGLILDRATFKHTSIFDAYKWLIDRVGDWTFWIDENSDLHFKPRNAVPSGVTLNNTNTLNATTDRDAEYVKNKIYIYGAPILVEVPPLNFVSDGIGSVWQLQYEPHNTTVFFSGVEQVGGIFNQNIEPESGTNYLVNFHDKQVYPTSGPDIGDSMPPSGTAVQVRYYRRRPIVKVAQDLASQGRYDVKPMDIVDETIQDPALAEKVVSTELAKRKDELVETSIKVEGILSLQPGETVFVDLPFHNINNVEYDIIECIYDFTKKKMFSDTVLQVKVSKRRKNISDIIKELALEINRLRAQNIDTDNIITRIEQFVGSVGPVMNFTIKTNDIGSAFVVNHPINGLVGSTHAYVGGTVGGEVIYTSGGEW